MKHIFFVAIVLFLMVGYVQAEDIELAWDSSVSAGVEGYTVYRKDFSVAYDYNSPACSTSGLSCTITVPDDRQSAFVARAWGYGPYDLEGNRTVIWSGNSNEAIHISDVQVPEPPRSLLFRILTAILNFFRGFKFWG